MTKTKKRFLFYGFLVIFLLGTCVTILYAQGYKYDFTRSAFVKTGALSLKTNIDADVYINDKYAGPTSFFGSTFRMDRLLPGIYVVKIEKVGFSSWTKKITISEGFVSDFSHIMLLPNGGSDNKAMKLEIVENNNNFTAEMRLITNAKNQKKILRIPGLSDYYFKEGSILKITDNSDEIHITTIADEIVGYSLSPDKDKIAWWNNNELYIYWIRSPSYYNRLVGTNELLSRYSTTIESAGWFRDSDHVLVNVGSNKIVEVDTRGGINIVTL
ncbi:MAG: hypothetical protein UT53_C0013G0001 [Candidatus Yanofskybacteria bacterium GW2011_GWD2_39_48]|uniref:PEGA domain-containing protein n=1 Tax=Candidatus Yanofskybacteria bacterium GW2011_GWD2_39_48 TaxID=1619031 RepID=A0A0G0P5M7_9BACT|nr:MAG: hypothetical protein UT53_C0013G0001 [Candidatus Yanofskybacteria bacterium GW2011_GWD2_39_48]